MGGVLISYRWKGWESASLLAANLPPELKGQLLRDVEDEGRGVHVGYDLREELVRLVDEAEVVVCVVNEQWMNEIGRLWEPADFVRVELEHAMKRRTPILLAVTGEKRPTAADLPPILATLASAVWCPIRNDTERGDIAKLTDAITYHMLALAGRKCLERLEKVRRAWREFQDEKWYLGAEIDRYQEVCQLRGDPAADHRGAIERMREGVLSIADPEAYEDGLREHGGDLSRLLASRRG